MNVTFFYGTGDQTRPRACQASAHVTELNLQPHIRIKYSCFSSLTDTWELLVSENCYLPNVHIGTMLRIMQKLLSTASTAAKPQIEPVL